MDAFLEKGILVYNGPERMISYFRFGDIVIRSETIHRRRITYFRIVNVNVKTLDFSKLFLMEPFILPLRHVLGNLTRYGI